MTISSDPLIIGERLRIARKTAGLSQEDAARALDVAVRTVARWESGDSEGYLGHLAKLAELYQETPDALVGKAPAAPGLEDQVAALAAEVKALRALLLDPARLREAADALVEEERPDGEG